VKQIIKHRGVLSTMPSQFARDVDDHIAECLGIAVVGRGETEKEAIEDLEATIRGGARSVFGPLDATLVIEWPDGTSTVIVEGTS